ncbi:hypothetical protein HYQ46_001586 [Verticillium longisporum]|nr:hypothetical protein HYQ46_001586 [Verticillium longisporum]
MGSGVLGKVVTPGELLATVLAFEGLVTGVQRTVVTLQVLLAAEPTVAQLTDKRLGGVLGQRLLAAASKCLCSA